MRQRGDSGINADTDKDPDITGKHFDREHDSRTYTHERYPAKEQGTGDEQGPERHPPARGAPPTEGST